ncbi:MAG: DUF2934 domain-containing protein [Candidatus Brocadiia bacterium]
MARINQETNRNNSMRTLSHQELAEQIRQRAYELYQKKGQKNGNDMTDWLEAEREIKLKNGYKLK